MILSHEGVMKRLAYWRDVLQIEPYWKIQLTICESSDEIPDGHTECQGWIEVSKYDHAVLVLNETMIADADDLDDTLIHELLHIRFKPLEIAAGKVEGNLADWEGERLIVALARAILALEKRGRKRAKR